MKKTILILLLLLAPTAVAGLLDAREIGLVMESTLVDFDTTMIGLHIGPDDAPSLYYVSRIDETGWQGRLSGTYSGKTVDIYYTGTIAFIGGNDSRYDINYTSSWLFDGQSGSGSGSAIYTDPDFSFGIDLINMSVSGSASVTYGVATLTLSGSKSFTTHKLTVSGSASAIDVPLIGSVAEASVNLDYNQQTGSYHSWLEGKILGGWIWSKTKTINSGNIRQTKVTPAPPPPAKEPEPFVYPYPNGGYEYDPGFGDPYSPGYNNMVIVPEPATLVLLAFGGAMMLRKKRQ